MYLRPYECKPETPDSNILFIGWAGLECPDATQNFPAIVPRHSNRRNFSRSLVQIEIRGTMHVHRPVCKIYTARSA